MGRPHRRRSPRGPYKLAPHNCDAFMCVLDNPDWRVCLKCRRTWKRRP
jgi:hypothetical protein